MSPDEINYCFQQYVKLRRQAKERMMKSEHMNIRYAQLYSFLNNYVGEERIHFSLN